MSYRDAVDDAFEALEDAHDADGYPAGMYLVAIAQTHALLAIAAAIARDHDRPEGPVRYDG